MKHDEKDNNEKDKDKDKGCLFIIVFLIFAGGIPFAIDSAGEGPIGNFVIVAGGLTIAYLIARQFLYD